MALAGSSLNPPFKVYGVIETVTAFEMWAAGHHYNIAPAVLPAENRLYADRPDPGRIRSLERRSRERCPDAH
jgi:hypothetical protein